MTTPLPRFTCPRCRTSFDAAGRFCAACGAPMQGASALQQAQQSLRGTAPTAMPDDQDRRLSDSAREWLGRIVDGRYRVQEVVGRGGMGVVYKVEHVRMGKVAAMKVLHSDLARDTEVVTRFQHEAHAVSQLNHPNTVQVFDFGSSNGSLFLIMEYVRGMDLSRVLDRDGAMPARRALPIVLQVCGAVAEAHDLGIIHRDLKPENVLLTRGTGRQEFAKVLDFGLAKLIASKAAPTPDVTDRAIIVGTPYYMAPEQIRGEPVDARTDLYALAGMLYRMLTGTYVFSANTSMGILTKHLTEAVEPPSVRTPAATIDPRLDAVLLRALAKAPGDRYASVTEFANALEAASAGLLDPRLADSGEAAWRPATSSDDLEPVRLRRDDLEAFERGLRHRKRTWIIGIVGLAIAGIAAGAWLLTRPSALATGDVEPNDTLSQATRVAPGVLSGTLGQRRSRALGDVDLYRVVGVPPEHTVSVHVSGLPNLDIALALRDITGVERARANGQGQGGEEFLSRRRFADSVFIEVGQVLAPGALPVENVSDRYTLTIAVHPQDTASEVEPNGTAADASPLGAGGTLTGTLESQSDVDMIRLDAEVRQITLRAGLAMTWAGPDGVAHPVGVTETRLAAGTVIRVQAATAGLTGAPSWELATK